MDVRRVQNNSGFSSLARQVSALAPAPARSQKPVVFFNASTRLSGLSLNAAFNLLAGWTVRMAGAPTLHFVCHAGMSRCVLGTERDDAAQPPPCQACQAQSRVLYAGALVQALTWQPDSTLEKMLAGLDLDSLAQVTSNGLALGQLTLPALRWALRRHHLVDDENTRQIYRHYILSAENIARQFDALLERSQAKTVVLFNGMFYPEAAARQVALRRGLPVITHEVGIQPMSAYFTTGEATAYPIDIPDDFEMSEEQNDRLDEYLGQRFKGNFSMAGIRFWPEMQSMPGELLSRLENFRQVVPVFTNVIFDTSQGHANVVFPHMFAWLDTVLEIIQAHPETLFVIRAHPDEGRPGKESRESVAQWAESRDVRDLPNVLFVDTHEYLSSYELIQRCKFVMVYNSTIGLEAALMSAAVLCAGKARFTQIPTVFLPRSVDEFSRLAVDMLAAEKITIPPEYLRNARRFFYYQLFRTSLPFEDLLEEDKIWRGYVRLKKFDWQKLVPGQSPTLDVIREGILECGSFLFPDQNLPAED
jgi:hypothetical protein